MENTTLVDLDTLDQCVLAYPASVLDKCRRVKKMFVEQGNKEIDFVPIRKGRCTYSMSDSYLASPVRMADLDLAVLDKAHLSALDASGGIYGMQQKGVHLYCIDRALAFCVHVVADNHRTPLLNIVEDRAILQALITKNEVKDGTLKAIRCEIRRASISPLKLNIAGYCSSSEDEEL